MSEWSGRRVTQARAIVATWLPAPCGQCALTVEAEDEWVVGHVRSRGAHPELTWVVSNWQPEHRACSERTKQAGVIEKAKAEAYREVGVFPSSEAPESLRRFPYTHTGTATPPETRDGLSWASLCQDAPEWLTPHLDVPDDAAPPLWVSGVHPDAVGSYGQAAVEWLEANVTERGRPLRLRWWQILAVVLQLQHREDGTLCWRVVIESGPRRIGKSVRLRSMALWRLANGPEMFEPEQLVLHTGKDLAIVREVMRKAWAWADPREDWNIKRGMTEPEVSYLDVNRWVARSKDSTTGYDACLALCDEAWDVSPSSIDDDLEPTMLERESPQLVLTSTAHRKATSLMRGRLADVLSRDDGETMVLVWAAPHDADIGDEAAWRAASPHWSEDRRKMIASKYAKALAGEVDPEADDPDPMAGFLCQYLNRWPLRGRAVVRGNALIEEAPWADLAMLPDLDETPVAAAIESWFGRGTSLALAYRDEDRVIVSVSDHAELCNAVAQLKATGYRGRVTVGKSLMGDPALKSVNRVPSTQMTTAAVADFARLLAEGAILHDGGELLTGQVLEVRTMPGADGARLVSKDRADAIKAALWAVAAARSSSGRVLGIVLPTGVGA